MSVLGLCCEVLENVVVYCQFLLSELALTVGQPSRAK